MHKNKVIWHIIIWTLWCTVTSVGSLLRLNVIPWPPLLFNHLSLILVFYLIYSLVTSYKLKFSGEDVSEMNMKQQVVYFLGHWEVLGIIAVLFGNIVFSWFADHYFCRVGYFPRSALVDNFWLYADGKFARESFYASTGAFYGLYRATLIEKNRAIEFEKHVSMIARRDNHRLRGVVDRLQNKLTMLIKRLRADDEGLQ
jgi:hypothetical protein